MRQIIFKNKLKHFLLMFLLLIFTACSKNVLDKKPLTSFSDNSVWDSEDEALIGAFISRTYQQIPNGFMYSYPHTLSFSRVTDEVEGRGGAEDFINAGNINPSDLGPLNYWTSSSPNENYWRIIKRCNVFFMNIKESPIDDSIKQRLDGQMRFLRAYSYFMLTALYGGVPLVKEPFGLDDNFGIPRNSYDECMEFVIKELNTAANELPMNWNNSEKGRITKGAALAIKSRALLYMASPLNNPQDDLGKWQEAADAAKAVINLNQYSLFPDYKDLFLKKNSYNSEVIWSRPFNKVLTNESSSVELAIYPNGSNGYGQLGPLQNLVDDYEMKNGEIPVLGYQSDGVTPIVNPVSGYDPQNPYIDRDPRFYYTILYDGAPFKGREIETFDGGMDSNKSPLSPWNASPTGYNIRKFIDESITNPTSNNVANPPWIFIRYAEILMNYAEAEYHLGNEDIARKYIDMVRSRPGVNMPPVTASGEDLLKAIQEEDRIEFVFEGHRYFDVRRWKIAPDVLNEPARRIVIKKDPDSGKKSYSVTILVERAFHERNYLVPIPKSEIEKDPQLEQNPGY